MTQPAVPDPIIRDVPVALALAKIEAKLDVAIAQHGAQLQDHERRLTLDEAEIRELDQRTTANALTTAETREVVRQVSDQVRDVITESRADSRTERTQLPIWIGVAIAALAVIASPILSALLIH